jgi:hypothetical protein
MKTIKQFPCYSIDEAGTVIRNDLNGKNIAIWNQSIKKKETGYKYATLRGDFYTWKAIAVHRLVALTYIPNPNNLPEVNHKDMNRGNNHYLNLEWTTHKANVQHSFNNGRTAPSGEKSKLFGRKATQKTKHLMSISKLGDKHPKFKGVYYVFYKPYNSSIEAYRATNICSRTIQRRCKKGQPGTDYYFVPTKIS